MEWPEKITVEMDKDVNGIWFPSFSPFPLVYGKCDYIRADLVADREQELKAEILDYLDRIGNINKENKFSSEITRYLRKAIEALNKMETTE